MDVKKSELFEFVSTKVLVWLSVSVSNFNMYSKIDVFEFIFYFPNIGIHIHIQKIWNYHIRSVSMKHKVSSKTL